MKNLVTITFLFFTIVLWAQKGEEKNQTLSLDRSNYTFTGEKTGFNFTNLRFGYQFVNCGGDVQLGINYNKNVNFTSFSYNAKNVGASEVGSELWPKSNEIELQEIEANLYFGNQNLGKVNLNYIIGNFSGCFGETFDVLAQVGLDPKTKQYKEQINDLNLRNITIIRADAIGDNRKNQIIEKLKAKDIDSEVLRLYKAADVESSLGNYETARGYYQDANRLKYSPETQNRINEMNRLISERNSQEKETAKSAPPTSNTSSSTNSTTSKPTNAKKKETSNKEEKEEEKTTVLKKEEDTYIDRSARNEVRQNSGLNNTYSNTNQNNNALVNQGYAINQQSKRTEQAIDNTASQINSIFQGNIDRINREKRARDAQEDDSYENTALYRADQERKRKEREAEVWRKNQLTIKTQSRQERLDAYNAKGGIENYNSQLFAWRKLALNGMNQINQYILSYNGNPISFGENMGLKVIVPNNNCEYVQVIDSIQFSAMPISYKNTLISNLLNIRFEYYKFYSENAYQELDWKLHGDNLYWDMNYATCGNYLDEVAITLKSGFYNSGADLMRYVNNKYSNSEMAEGNYEIPVGTNSDSKVFFIEGRNLGITSIHNESLNSFINYNLDQVWLKFHTDPWNWSNSSFSFDRKDKYMKSLPKSMSSMQIEIDRYIALYNLKREFALNSIDDEKKQMFFNYHMGNYKEAYNHFQRYVFFEYGSFQELLEFVKTIKKGNDGHIGITGAILLMENEEFDKALQLTKVIKESDWVKHQKSRDTYLYVVNNNYEINENYNPLIAAADKINNYIYYQTGAYDKIMLPKSENEIKEVLKNVENQFKFVPKDKHIYRQYNMEMPILLERLEREYLDNTTPHIQASALINLGNLKLAEAVLEDMVKYYTKNDKNNPRIFYGSSIDINAFKTSVKTLFPGKEDKIEYRVGNMNLFPFQYQYFFNVPIMYLTRLPHIKPTYINTNPIDLSTNEQWKTVKKLLYEHNGSKEKMLAILESLRNLYVLGKLEHNEESKFFLEVYMNFALALGEFHEATIGMAQLNDNYPDHGFNFQRNLIKLMWPQKENEVVKANGNKIFGYSKESSHLKDYFEIEVKNNEQLKDELNWFLSLWSNLKVSSPLIPYLYSLY